MKKFIRQCLASLFVIVTPTMGLAAIPYAYPGTNESSEEYVSLEEVREFLKSQGFVGARKRTGSLQLAGDVRARWILQREDHKKELPNGKPEPLPINRYRSDFNLYMDYASEDSWMTSHMNAVAVAGGEGTAAGLDIDRAFLGYLLLKRPESKTKAYVEVGRSGLGDIFDSSLQFNSDFDGIHFYLGRRISDCLPYTVALHGGPFVVNMKNKHYAWVVEGVVDRLPQGITCKVSAIDWHSFSVKQNDVKQNYKYLVWQFLVGKTAYVPWFQGKMKKAYVYGTYLFNSHAKASELTANSKQNRAISFGATLGQLKEAKDWAVTVHYEYVEALAIPTIDVSGIGKGTTALKYWPAQVAQGGFDMNDVKGFTNYKGVSYLFMYGLTDTLSLRAYAAVARPTDKAILDFNYRKFDIGLISSF